VYRGADALSAQVSNAVSASGAGPTGVALLGVAVAALWAALGWWLGRHHDKGNVKVLEEKPQHDAAPAA
jgi:AAA family ATP:ADP antiporter